MRIFVTGATGFVGGHFVERALASGHEVSGIYHSETPDKRAFADQLRSLGAVLQRASILDPGALAPLMQGANCVCHFAAAFRESGVDDEHFRRLNVAGTESAVRAAAAAGVQRFILCSTAGIYGQRLPQVVDEQATPKPWNIYESTKLAGEEAVRRLTAEFGLEYVILRPTAVYGPRDERLLKLFRSAAKGRFPLFGAGKGRRHMVYVTDLADAFVKACESPAAAGGEFIIGGPRAVPLHEMLGTLAQVLGRRNCGPQLPLKPMQWLAAIVEDLSSVAGIKPPLYRRRMDFYLNDAEFSSARAEQVLGWRPATDLRTGLATTLASYRGTGQLGTASISVVDFASAAGVLSIAGELWPLASALV